MDSMNSVSLNPFICAFLGQVQGCIDAVGKYYSNVKIVCFQASVLNEEEIFFLESVFLR